MRWGRSICGFGVVLAATLVAASANAGDEDRAAPETWYARSLARSESALNVTYFWSKGPKMRSETVILGHRIVTIVNGETYYAYDASAGHGIAIGRAAEAIAADAPKRRPFGQEVETLLRQGAEKVGEETVRGRTCDLYRVTDSAGRRQVWTTQDEPRVTIKIEIFNRPTGGRQYIDYDEWLRGLPIADSFFEPSAALRLERFTLEEYLLRSAREGPVGPVPILYADLLHGRSKPSGSAAD
ncbi:MAG: DUF4412 domain-containing protein [Myxococcales bacterium]|nr:DUF4412 domain-containing protein [Myxococcales bacterium]